MAEIKIITYNINGLVGSKNNSGNSDYLLKFMKKNNPDIVCLQETKIGNIEKALKKLKEKLSEEDTKKLDEYELLSVESAYPKGHAGCAVYYKKDKEIPTYISEHSDELFGRILTVEFDKFYLINAYLHNSDKDKQAKKDKIKYFEWLIDTFSTLGKPCIIAGDYNVGRYYSRNETRPIERTNAGFYNFEKKLFQDLLNKGFVDTFKYKYPTDEAVAEHMKSVPEIYENWYTLDYILVSEQLTKNIIDCKVYTEYKRSDSTHLPLSMTIDI